MPTTNASPRQTLTYLRHLFEARGLRPKTKLGQCFLIDLNLIDLILRCGELSRDDLVLEVGTGTGNLTSRLAELAGGVFGVEIDSGFYELARDNTAAFANAAILNADILRHKNEINPEVMERLSSGLAKGLKRLKLVANLPYVVATPVIANFLISDLPFERMVVTIQWELAERLIARPSTKEYGALSVLVQSLADVEILRKLPPRVFWPRPKVESGIVLIRPSMEKRAKIGDVRRFRDFLRDLYVHRRKNLRGALLSVVGDRFSKEQLDDHLRSHGFDPTGRAEALNVEDHLRLCMSFENAKRA